MARLGLVFVGACVACAPTEASPPGPAPEREPAEARASEEPEPSSGIQLRWSFEPDDRWTETTTTQTFILQHPKGGADERRPAVTTRRVERFQVLEASAEGARLSMTPIALRQAVRDGEATVVIDEQTPVSELGDASVVKELASIGIPLVSTVGPLGTVERVHDLAAHVEAVGARFDELARGCEASERLEERRSLDGDLALLPARLEGWGQRPRLPAEAVSVTSAWTHQVRVPSLFGSTVVFEVRSSVHRLTDTMAVVTFRGQGTLEPTPAMAEVFEDAELSVRGHFWMDRRRGILFEHAETHEMSVTLRPHPSLGEGGTLSMRQERRRVSDRRPSRPRRAPPSRLSPTFSLQTRSGRLRMLVWADSDLDEYDPVLDGRPRRPEKWPSLTGTELDPLGGL